jgi:starch phosphorylase
VQDHAARAIEDAPRLRAALDAIHEGAMSTGEPARFHDITGNLRGPDYFLVCSDFADYWRAQREVDAAYRDAAGWTRMAALNTARSGWFSSDRTIRGYMGDIWGARSLLRQA